MADDYRAERVLGVQRATEFPQQHDTPQRRGYHAYAAQHPEPPQQHSIHDVALLLGLDAGTLSQAVVAAVMPLLAEIDRLRTLAEQNERRRSYIEKVADRHSVVPCLNRRAFMRELDAVLLGGGGVGILAALHFGGVEQLCLENGLAAADAALRHIGAVMIGAIRASDLLGCVGGTDFALLLTGSDGETARAKLADIRFGINEPPFVWLGQPVVLDCQIGQVAPNPGEGGEQALAAADRVRRGLE